MAELGARDYQHAFDRALLQGQIECARWLHAHGAKLEPGIIMGSCETLKVEGFQFLLERDAPLVNERGDRLAPLVLTLETYCRRPAGKHAILVLFAKQGYTLPDTPMMTHLSRAELGKSSGARAIGNVGSGPFEGRTCCRSGFIPRPIAA